MQELNYACQITKSYIYIQNQEKFKSLSEKWNGSQDELIDRVGRPLKWCLEVWWRVPLGEMRSDEKIECEFLEVCSCSSFKIWLRRFFFLEMGVRSFLVEKDVFVLSHTSSSLVLQMKVTQISLKEKTFGGNIGAWMERVAQRSLKYWIRTLEINLGTFPLSPINDPIQYLS